MASLLVLGCPADPPPPEPPAGLAAPAGADYLAQVEAWREGRLAELRQPDGWLSLAGLYWLDEGESSLGADPRSDLVLPPGRAAPSVGRLVRAGDTVRFVAAAEARVTRVGEPVSEVELTGGAGGEPPVLAHRTLRFHVLERGRRVGLRLKDLESPRIAAFAGIDHFPVDPAWRIEARFEPFGEPRMLAVPDVLGDVNDRPSHGRLLFTIAGVEQSLTPLGEPHDELFVVFGDETNGGETYGGGRFLSAGPPGADGRLILDFNKAYNPPCVFTPYATCPLPPPGNRLSLAVEAGEKSFDGVDHGDEPAV